MLYFHTNTYTYNIFPITTVCLYVCLQALALFITSTKPSYLSLNLFSGLMQRIFVVIIGFYCKLTRVELSTVLSVEDYVSYLQRRCQLSLLAYLPLFSAYVQQCVQAQSQINKTDTKIRQENGKINSSAKVMRNNHNKRKIINRPKKCFLKYTKIKKKCLLFPRITDSAYFLKYLYIEIFEYPFIGPYF